MYIILLFMNKSNMKNKFILLPPSEVRSPKPGDMHYDMHYNE